jgi:hypothetical protein
MRSDDISGRVGADGGVGGENGKIKGRSSRRPKRARSFGKV